MFDNPTKFDFKAFIPTLLSVCLWVAFSTATVAQQGAPTSSSNEQVGQDNSGEEEGENSDDLATTESKQQTNPVPKQGEPSKNPAPGEVFNPTEEISEDSPVPFPVDI